MKKGCFLITALLVLLAVCCPCAAQDDDMVIVTSFYPMYVFARNVANGIPGVTVVNMADQNVGCLHDYQLQTRDMVTLETADVLIVNGGGMEQFMDKIAQSYGELTVITAGEGIDMLESAHSGHEHDHDHSDEEGCLLNAHVWLDPALAQQEIRSIADGLIKADPEHADAYEANACAYMERIAALDGEIRTLLAPYAGEKIITFHEAFTYFANAYGLEVAGLIEHDSGEEPGTRDLANTCDLVRELGIGALFVEPQYPQKAASTIARETGASVYQLDPVVSGDGEMDSYERAMRENARVFAEAFGK
ncbi:MAG: zinc ABC transporter substrate-binding protein [Clostridia bacterium]|nr:zinc ABC transporter substrate-binding protein [Clostridia bacterium]